MSGEGITPSVRPLCGRTLRRWHSRTGVQGHPYMHSLTYSRTYVHQASRGCILFLDASICIHVLKKPLTLQRVLLPPLLLRLDGVEDGGADQEVGERADDEAEGADVLLLHATGRATERAAAAAGG